MNAPRSAFDRWKLEDIDFDHAARERIRDDVVLFRLLCGSSFVESDTPLYAANLAAFGRADAEFARWVRHDWEREEVRHGQALRRYVQAVWPEYDWEAAYRAFRRDYDPICRVDAFQHTLALEMVSRCVVEVGTATYYGMLASYASDPVLKTLAGHIRSDEVHHYTEFLKTFERNRDSGVRRLSVVKSIASRLNDIESEDTIIAERHIFEGLPADHPFRAIDTRALNERTATAIRAHYPMRMGATMLLRLLHLPEVLRRPLVPTLATVGRWFVGQVGQVASTGT